MHKPLISLAFIVLLAVTLGACTAPEAGTDPPPVATEPVAVGNDDPLNLDSSCRVDSDCAVKNVGNCCGYFPACVNVDAQPDPEAVMARCAESGMASVCGFREIQACSCVQNQCEPERRSMQAPLE